MDLLERFTWSVVSLIGYVFCYWLGRKHEREDMERRKEIEGK